MTLYQFHSYLQNIGEIEKMKNPTDKGEKTTKYNNNELIKRSKAKGFITPSKY